MAANAVRSATLRVVAEASAAIKPHIRAAAKVQTSKEYYPHQFKSKADYTVNFPTAVHEELSTYAKRLAKQNTNIDTIKLNTDEIPTTKQFIKHIEHDQILNGRGFVLLPTIKGISTIPEMRLAIFALTSCCGEPLVQNAEGNKGVLVYDRDASKLMRDGQRYHQSHEGGSLHTDNVNIPQVWESMFLTCLHPAFIGGENIIVSAAAVHNFLVEQSPESVEALQEDFLWEYRGFSNKFYKAPILYYNSRGEPCFRYLRDYMESAHFRLKSPMSRAQLTAINLIDACNELSQFQLRTTINKGETLWCNDVQTFHGRTRFVDPARATAQYDMLNPRNRLFQRTWVKSEHKEFRDLNQSRYENLEA